MHNELLGNVTFVMQEVCRDPVERQSWAFLDSLVGLLN